MSAILQIVDGHNGGLVLELNGWVGSRAGFARSGMNLTEGQLSGSADDVAWSPLSSPAPLGRRRITVPFLLVGTSADDLGARVAKLMEATRGPWWLRVRRHNATVDSWLQCYGCVPQVSSQITASAGAHMVQGAIECETAPYALGARVDGGPTTIGQDPSSPAWGVTINNVQGDTPTPLLLRMKDENAFSGAVGAFISTRRRRTPAALTAGVLTRQAEHSSNIRTPGDDVTMAVVDSASSSGGKALRLAFSSGYPAGQASSVTFAAPSLSTDVPGTYRMFLRVARDAVAGLQPVVFRAFTNAALITPEDITLPAGGDVDRLVDLGLVQWPAAAPAGIVSPIPTPSGAQPTRVTVQFWRKDGGAANIYFDYLCWIPADEDAGYLNLDKSLPDPDTQWVVVDGAANQAMVTSADPRTPHTILGQSYASSAPTVDFSGGAPHVRPGDTRLFVVAGLSTDEWYIGRTINVAWSYWPRYSWLR